MRCMIHAARHHRSARALRSRFDPMPHAVPEPRLETPSLGHRRRTTCGSAFAAFIAEEIARRPLRADRCNSWTEGLSSEFSRRLGARGWIGYHWPRSTAAAAAVPSTRLTINEELLAAGAPVGAHWIAARQSAPLLMRFGSEAQRQEFLPRIAAGELYFAIGMSEPDVGSDLASVRTRAERRGSALGPERAQGLDQRRPPVPLRDRAVPHRARRPEGAPRRPEPVDRRPAAPRA